MEKEVLEVFISDFIEAGGEFPTRVTYEVEETKEVAIDDTRTEEEIMGVYDVEVDIEPKEIIKEEEALYFELVEQTKELPNSEIFDLVKQFFEELRGVENAK